MENRLKSIFCPEYQKEYYSTCSNCHRSFPMVELRPSPENREAIRKFVSAGEPLKLNGTNMYCHECHKKLFGKEPC